MIFKKKNIFDYFHYFTRYYNGTILVGHPVWGVYTHIYRGTTSGWCNELWHDVRLTCVRSILYTVFCHRVCMLSELFSRSFFPSPRTPNIRRAQFSRHLNVCGEINSAPPPPGSFVADSSRAAHAYRRGNGRGFPNGKADVERRDVER